LPSYTGGQKVHNDTDFPTAPHFLRQQISSNFKTPQISLHQTQLLYGCISEDSV